MRAASIKGWPLIGAGTKIEFLTDQGETLSNEYLLCKNFKTSLERSLVTKSAHVACSRAGTWAELVTKDRSSDKKCETSFEVLA